jgi:hypothetical protein
VVQETSRHGHEDRIEQFQGRVDVRLLGAKDQEVVEG